MSNYIQNALRTASGNFYPERIDQHQLEGALLKFSNVANFLDMFKKAGFYGKQNGDLPQVLTPMVLPEGCSKDMFHAIIGILTEAGELAEALLNAYTGVKPIDAVNVVEEFGDLFWYAAIGCNEAGKTFEQIQDTNIAKLKVRFPDKFTEENAINRDLEKERKILASDNTFCENCNSSNLKQTEISGFLQCVDCNALTPEII